MLASARHAPVRIAVLLIAILVVGAACTPLNSQESYLFSKTNEFRSDHGVDGVLEYEPLTARAREWAATIAARGTLDHSDLHSLSVQWTAAAENVGRSSSVEDVVSRMEASPLHRANMLNPAYRLTGVGSARAKDGSVYVVQIFLRS